MEVEEMLGNKHVKCVGEIACTRLGNINGFSFFFQFWKYLHFSSVTAAAAMSATVIKSLFRYIYNRLNIGQRVIYIYNVFECTVHVFQ